MGGKKFHAVKVEPSNLFLCLVGMFMLLVYQIAATIWASDTRQEGGMIRLSAFRQFSQVIAQNVKKGAASGESD